MPDQHVPSRQQQQLQAQRAQQTRQLQQIQMQQAARGPVRRSVRELPPRQEQPPPVYAPANGYYEQ